MLTITYTSQYERWVDSLNLHVWSNIQRASLFVVLYVVLPMVAATELLFVLLTTNGHRLGFVKLATFPAFWVLIFCAILWGLRATNRRTQYAKLWPPDVKDQRNILSFSEEGIKVFSNGIGESDLQWSAIRRVARNKRMILLYVGACSFIVVPLEGLTEDEQASLTSLIDRSVKPSL